jgi:hypothetical protein
MLLDAAVSLACHPGGYWNHPSVVDEANPTWGYLLALGPAAFLLGFMVYMGVMMCLLLWLTGALQKLLGAFVLLSHSYGAASWCHVRLPGAAYWWALMGLFLMEAAAFAAYWGLRERWLKARAAGVRRLSPPNRHLPE